MRGSSPPDPVDEAIKSFLNPKLWKFFGLLLFIANSVTLLIVHEIVESLLYVGRGVRAVNPLVFMLACVAMFVLAGHFQTLGGDLLFFVAWLYMIKTIADWVWARRRRRAGSQESTLERGVLVFEAIGIRSDMLALVGVTALGLVLAATPIGALVGPLLVLGSLTGLVYNLLGRNKLEGELAREQDAAIEAELWGRISDHRSTRGGGFQDVDIR